MSMGPTGPAKTGCARDGLGCRAPRTTADESPNRGLLVEGAARIRAEPSSTETETIMRHAPGAVQGARSGGRLDAVTRHASRPERPTARCAKTERRVGCGRSFAHIEEISSRDFLCVTPASSRRHVGTSGGHFVTAGSTSGRAPPGAPRWIVGDRSGQRTPRSRISPAPNMDPSAGARAAKRASRLWTTLWTSWGGRAAGNHRPAQRPIVFAIITFMISFVPA